VQRPFPLGGFEILPSQQVSLQLRLGRHGFLMWRHGHETKPTYSFWKFLCSKWPRKRTDIKHTDATNWLGTQECLPPWHSGEELAFPHQNKKALALHMFHIATQPWKISTSCSLSQVNGKYPTSIVWRSPRGTTIECSNYLASKSFRDPHN
jgi:hypothetical protein